MNNLHTVFERFETAFVLRIARTAPLVLAGVAALTLVVAALVFIVSLVPPREPVEPQASEPPPLAHIAIEDVEQALAPASESRAESEPSASPTEAERAPTHSAAALALASELHQTRGAMAEAGIAWESEYRTVCTEQFFGTCVSRRRQLAVRGFGQPILELLSLHDTTLGQETVRVEDGDASYTLNASNAAVKTQILEEARAIVAAELSAEPEERLGAWLELREAADLARADRIRAERERAQRDFAAAQALYEEAATARQMRLATSAIAAGVGLGALILLGLCLAVLAIERNTRALHRMAAMPGRGASRAEEVVTV